MGSYCSLRVFFPNHHFCFGFPGCLGLTQQWYFVVGCILVMDWMGKSKEPYLIGWLCVWCMVWLGWVHPRTPPCYWLIPLIVYETQQCVELTVDMLFGLCVSLLFPISLWNYAQLRGGSDAKRLMSTLAYGWVERCSDVASCGLSSS